MTDIKQNGAVKGRLFILADGHGGPGCSEYFVRETPAAVEKLCADYDVTTLGDEQVQKKLESDIKTMIQVLDDEYLRMKREQIENKSSPDEHIDNDGCTLILNIFLGEWLININVGDSRTVLISAPEPSAAPPTSIENANTLGIDSDYKMDVVFASQDHKPYLEHLARHILENGGEFVDSVQNRVIKVDADKLREDGNRHAKRISLKNARIRPKDYQAGLDRAAETTVTNEVGGWAAQSAVRTTANTNTNQASNPAVKTRIRDDRIPSLNVARSCGDLDFKMDPLHKIISCEPDVTFIRISDQPYVDHTILLNGPHKEKRRHFLFMSTDGTFDYMYEETAERQNRAIAKVIGPMIEDGEKIGKYLLEEEERIKGQTIEHGKDNKTEQIKKDDKKVDKKEDKKENKRENKRENKKKKEDKKEDKNEDSMDVDDKESNNSEGMTDDKSVKMESVDEKEDELKDKEMKDGTKEEISKEDNAKEDGIKEDGAKEEENIKEDNTKEDNVKEDSTKDESEKDESAKDENAKDTEVEKTADVSPMDVDVPSTDESKESEEKTDLPRIPLLYRELTEEEAQARKVKERTLVSSARYFANREGAHGFFASTLQDYDDCTIILVEI